MPNQYRQSRGIKRSSRYPAISSDSRRILQSSVGDRVTSWTADTALKLGVYVIPGESFYLARDLLIFPRSSFLACGMLGLCGLALYPRKKLPFLDFTIMPEAYIDDDTWESTFEYRGYDAQKNRVRNRVARLRDFLVWGLRRGDGQYSAAGERDAKACLARDRIADWELYSK